MAVLLFSLFLFSMLVNYADLVGWSLSDLMQFLTGRALGADSPVILAKRAVFDLIPLSKYLFNILVIK